jgi:hypothetical protein
VCYTPLRIEVYEKTQAFIATTYLHRKEVARLHTYRVPQNGFIKVLYKV